MKIVNQPYFGAGACGGCTAAMIAGESYEDFAQYADPLSPPFDAKIVFDYLLSKGIIPGYHMNFIYPVKDDTGRVVAYKADISLNNPAYVVVAIGGKTHAIFWDGEKVWDCNNSEPTDNICDYKIISWTPLFIPSESPAEQISLSGLSVSVVGGTTIININNAAPLAAQMPCALTMIREN